MAPLIGAEKSSGKAALPQWNEDLSDEEVSDYTKSGMSIQPEMERAIMSDFEAEYHRLMRKVRYILSIHGYLLMLYISQATRSTASKAGRLQGDCNPTLEHTRAIRTRLSINASCVGKIPAAAPTGSKCW